MSSLPRVRSKIGKFKVLFVSIKWNDRSFELQELKKIASQVEIIYKKVSRGQFQIIPSFVIYTSNLEPDKKNLEIVEDEIKKKFKSEYYVIINHLGTSFTDHASGKIAHVKSGLVRTICHELGHLLGLNHAGKFNEDGTYDQYGDHLSFMGRYANNELTSPSMYKMGWIPKLEIVNFATNGNYRIKNLFNKKLNYYSIVIIHISDERYVFVSFQDNSICLHISRNGGSQKIKQIGTNEFKDTEFTKKSYQQIEKNAEYVIVRISNLKSL